MSERKIINLYEHYKNTPKKLKIICDWDEVIQPAEPYALWKTLWGDKKWEDEWQKKHDIKRFIDFVFWGDTTFDEYNLGNKMGIEYSPYGSKLDMSQCGEFVKDKQSKIKNFPNFYQEAPFLTIAEDLLKLIKEDKIEQIIFLTAYDKRKFPNKDPRKTKIFLDTFGKWWIDAGMKCKVSNMRLEMVGFESETQGQSKVDWIKENASDFDLVIDDNPIICRSLVENLEKREDVVFEENSKDYDKTILHPKPMTIIAPYYPAVESKHDERVLWVKNEVSNLKKEDFN